MSLVVSQLIGGLGNQLFQYSAGRALADKLGVRLKLDVSQLEAGSSRAYALAPFSLQADVLSKKDIQRLGLERPTRRFFGFPIGGLPGRRVQVVAEKSFEFDPTILDARAPCYLRGYWQSPKYFEFIEKKIRSELTLHTPSVGLNAYTADRIRSSDAVSVHIRRGDYAANPKTNKFHGTCSVEYYTSAEALLLRRIESPTLFVFSDDPEWVRSNLRLVSQTVIVDHNAPSEAHEDLRLMAMCRHHIIANSTLSWWGAWLSQNESKFIVAPKRWFMDETIVTNDLIPNDWTRL